MHAMRFDIKFVELDTKNQMTEREIIFHFQPFPMSLYDLLEQSLPFYNMLRHHVRKTSSLLKSPLPEPHLPVPANKNLLAWVGDEIVPRDDAKVFD